LDSGYASQVKRLNRLHFLLGGREAFMQKDIGWLWIVGFFGLVSAAGAQAPSSPTASTQFDGTYRFVSSVKLNETYTTSRGGERMGQCPDPGKEGRSPL
jgi:hypothetical protein